MFNFFFFFEYQLGGTNIIKLLAVVEILGMDLTALVFEQLINNEDFKNVYLKLPEEDVRFYLHEILKALDYCHSNGIMHRYFGYYIGIFKQC